MNKVVTDTLDRDGVSIPVLDQKSQGSLDDAELNSTGIKFKGWAASLTQRDQPASRPLEILVAVGGKVIYTYRFPQEHRNVAPVVNNQAAIFDFILDVGLVPSLLQTNLNLYTFDGQAAARLPASPNASRLAELAISSVHDFNRLIQTPSTRIQNMQALAYAAFHCATRLPNDFPVRAAALCVVGYRLLNHETEDQTLRLFFERESSILLAEKPKVPRGLFLRWHTSVRLIAGYLAFQAGQDADALAHFAAIPNFVSDLVEWPQALTNLLLGLFISGYFRFRAGDIDAAVAEWSRGEGIFRFGSSIAEFQNFYAYGEVGNALRVVQECYVAIHVARGGGPINNPSLAPVGTDIDLRRLPSPLAKLVSAID